MAQWLCWAGRMISNSGQSENGLDLSGSVKNRGGGEFVEFLFVLFVEVAPKNLDTHFLLGRFENLTDLTIKMTWPIAMMEDFVTETAEDIPLTRKDSQAAWFWYRILKSYEITRAGPADDQKSHEKPRKASLVHPSPPHKNDLNPIKYLRLFGKKHHPLAKFLQ